MIGYHLISTLINFRVFTGRWTRGLGEFIINMVITGDLSRQVGGALPIIRTPTACFCEGCTRASMGTRAKVGLLMGQLRLIELHVVIFLTW